jgi:hypothetical protein
MSASETMRRSIRAASACLAAALLAPAAPGQAPGQAPIRGPRPGVSLAPTAVFDRQGTLWLAWAEGQHVYVSSSADEGKTFGPARVVNPEPEPIDANNESRPKIAVGSQGEVFVTYTRKLSQPHTGEVRFSRSLDGGASFSPPRTVNDDGLETGHRFDTLAVSPDGRVWVFWIDKRDLVRAAAQQKPYEGAALYFAVSSDAGRTFSANRKVKDNICECCRLAVAMPPDGRPVILWRDILPGGIRDHSIVRVEGEAQAGAVRRATFDDWAIAGCPHQGPSLAVSGDVYHLVWFTGAGPRGAGAFYARSADGGRTFAEPKRLGPARPGGRPFVLARDGEVHVAWKEPVSGGEGTLVRVSSSADGGRTWSKPAEAARSEGDSDHPFLLERGGQVFLSWFDSRGGYRLAAVGGRAATSRAQEPPSGGSPR